MNAKIKLAAYAVVAALIVWFAAGFYSSYNEVTREAAAAAAVDNQTNPAPAPTTATNTSPDTNAAATNLVAVTTNLDTNAPAATNTAVVPVPAPAPVAAAHHNAHGRMIGYLAAMVVALMIMGCFVAYEVTQYFGERTVDMLLDVSDEAVRDPEYEKAEQAWANGRHLEAIQMMREFLKAHPREQYAALRIAEIYEKDLNNPLAAALEYEEVLKKKLSSERWGWAAIHLCNLYSKLGQQDKTRALLQRIADEYPKTGAAKKARARLNLPEPETPGVPGTEAAPAVTEAEAEPPEPEDPNAPKLPPGFRKK